MNDCCTIPRPDQNSFDMAVIGAGSAGFSASITAAGAGKRVALIGHGLIGGTCVNVGCVPSKALIRAAEAIHGAKAAKRFPGLSGAAQVDDWAALMAGGADVLANAMTFDMDLDRAVSKDEFIAGLKRLAGQIQPSGDLAFTDLIQPLNRLKEEASNQGGFGWGTLAPRGSPPGGNRN